MAKAWLIALFEHSHLEDGPAIPVAELARDGPRLCAAVLHALADDDDLRRLELGGALEPLASRAGELAGATQAQASARAVDALTSVIWSAAREELARPDADQLEALGERLALVTELVRAAVLRRPEGTGAAGGTGAAAAPGKGAAARGMEPDNATTSAAGPALPRTDADSLWRGALEDEVARARHSGGQLALLLAELSDGDRLPAPAAVHVASESFGLFAQTVRGAIRREDIVACETQSRAWVIARLTGRAGARVLGSRIAHAVREAEPSRWAPLTVGIGIAILGEDAHDAPGLVEAADGWSFADISSGLGDVDTPGDGPGGC